MTPLRARNGTPIVGVVGWKKSGKTTLTVRLVETFTRRGYRVATIKHAHHAFEIDDGETDSARHRRAGARQVAIVSASRLAVVEELADRDEPDFMDVVDMLAPCDLILVEGYKSQPILKIEARRVMSSTRSPLAASDPLVMAIAADHEVSEKGRLPVFSLDDIDAMADLIAGRVGLSPPVTSSSATRPAETA